MRTHATQRSAAIVGAAAGVLLYFGASAMDAPGTEGAVWLLAFTLAIGVPAYFFVLGVPPEDRDPLRAVSLPLLARAASFMFAAAAVVAFAVLGAYAIEFLRVDDCLDLGGRWNAESRACER